MKVCLSRAQALPLHLQYLKKLGLRRWAGAHLVRGRGRGRVRVSVRVRVRVTGRVRAIIRGRGRVTQRAASPAAVVRLYDVEGAAAGTRPMRHRGSERRAWWG